MSHYPFDEKELQSVPYPLVDGPYGMKDLAAQKYNTPITPKENFARMIRGGEPMWAPCALEDVCIIQPMVMPDAQARCYGGIDWFGIDWKYEPIAGAAMVTPGTRRLSDLPNWREEIVWPDLNEIDWQADYEANFKDKVDNRGVVFAVVNGLFERLADMTSFEDLFCYLIEEEEELEAFYTKLTDWHIELFKIAKKYYNADAILLHDDMGSQKSPFISPAMYEEIMVPHYKRLTAAAHELGMGIILHSCGNVALLLPKFIEAGFDAWEGQEFVTDQVALMKQYGDKLGQSNSLIISGEADDEEALRVIEDYVDTYGCTARTLVWIDDGKAERKAWTRQQLYRISREKYGEMFK